jgi:hypothetical protein
VVNTESPATYARHAAVAVRLQAIFKNQTAAGSAEAEALSRLVRDPVQLKSILPAGASLATWQPSLEFVTYPYLANSDGGGAGIDATLGRVSGLHFTLKFRSTPLSVALTPQKQSAIKALIAANFTAVVNTTLAATEEVVSIGNISNTNAHLHALVRCCPLPLSTLFPSAPLTSERPCRLPLCCR